MSVCWYCHWGWARPVADIYRDALGKLGGDKSTLHYGPAHIVWCDENWEDDNVRYCLDCCTNERATWPDLTDAQIDVVAESLARLLEVSEDVRCCEPDDYDGENPESYPPPPGVECVKV